MSLAESIRLLHFTKVGFQNKAERHTAHFEKPTFPKLTELLERMSGVSAARRVFCPEEYRRFWTNFQAGKIAEIPPRVRRFLCWEPSIGTNLNFLRYLAGLGSPLSANALQGLVYAIHANWGSGDSRPERPELHIVRNFVKSYEGRNRLLKKWQDNLNLILDPQAPRLAAAAMFSQFQLISKFCTDWGLNELTAFMNAAIRECADLCIRQFEDVNSVDTSSVYFISEILAWKSFSLDVYKALVSQTVMTWKFLKDEKFQENVLAQILEDERLGDPRLPGNSKNWVGIAEEARTRIMQVLSRADIVFFFDQVMTDYEDRHGRKDFWLQYVSSLKQSRPLLNTTDKLRLRYVLKKQGNKMLHFGETFGQKSAFLLDFGSIIVIEFNGVGACYIYDDRYRRVLFPDIYTDQPFSDPKLKKPEFADERIRHIGNWQWRLRSILARYGIRPK
jgi:hypothetical protein